MEFKVKVGNEVQTYYKKTSLLEIIGDRDPEKRIVAAKVNNPVFGK